MADRRPVDAAFNAYVTQRDAEQKALAAEFAAYRAAHPADPTTPVVDPTPTPGTGDDAFLAAARGIPGLRHFYPLDAENQARDVVGSAHGTVKGTGTTFGEAAVFTGRGYIELPDSDDFSVATRQGLTIVATVAITDWRGVGSSEYIHWMGKGVSGAHEWTFRHYIEGGSGEASARQGRTSFYHFNPSGGLGAGSYFQDAMDRTERVIVATCDMRQIQMYRDGRLRDTDALSGYSITPRNTGTPVRIGTRDMSTGYLIGKIRRVGFWDRVLTETQVRSLSSAATA